MKSELKEAENTSTKKRKYPYIGRYTSTEDSGIYVCVLFTERNTGTNVAYSSDCLHHIGFYSTAWVESTFEVLPPNTQIILQND